MVSRREVLQGLIISLGGAGALSACNGIPNILATASGESPRFYSDAEIALVSRVCDLIIPRTETPGALDANVPGYLDGLMVDWADAETQTRHRSELAQLESQLESRAGNDFRAIDASMAETVLRELDRDAFDDGEDLGGYRRLKGYITQAYFATEEGATEELQWVAIPGRWDPDVRV